jgi:hypothetical protein
MYQSTTDDVKKAQFIARGVGMKERDGKENIKNKVTFCSLLQIARFNS